MNPSEPPNLETDPRFPSGKWTGFYLAPMEPPGKHVMELQLSFHDGTMSGEGRDKVGPFVLRGQYVLADGKCRFTKRYVGKHDVFYTGYNEGKGIWGVWEIPAKSPYPALRGGFHVWPEGMGDPTDSQLDEEIDELVGSDEPVVVTEPSYVEV